MTTGAYSFLPWLRRGIANQITAADGDTSVKQRARIPVSLKITGDAVGGGTVTADVSHDIELYSPGDVVGIDTKAIVRTEPRPWVTNFEPNYLPFIEFYDEDFCWRYTPAAPAGGRLRPWIALVVLAEDEFSGGAIVPGKPLPFIEVADLSVLPPAGQLWAWAHVHVNRGVTASATEIVSNDMGAVLPRLQAVLNENPDLACARLICPRRLKPDTAYHAFVVPTFETGRLAGLGLDPAGAPHATHSAWQAYPSGTRPEPDRLCFYHRWFFRTGIVGDFEYLVRLLKPRPVDPRVGTRDMDVLRPGANLPAISDAALAGVLRLGGALRVPEEDLDTAAKAKAALYENWDAPYPHGFQRSLAALINLADDYSTTSAPDANGSSGLGSDAESDPDPLITPPLYGRWHALVSRLLTGRDGSGVTPNNNWVHELNLDPRFRTAAGFGTDVIRTNQEEYMAAAWEQVGDVLEANRRIRMAQLAREASFIWHAQHLQPLRAADPARALSITAPVHPRLLDGDVTLSYRAAASTIGSTPMSAAMRRLTRPRARLIRGLPFTAALPRGALLARLDTGQVSPAPAKHAPASMATVDKLASAIRPRVLPPALLDALVRSAWLRWLPLLLALVAVLFADIGLWPVGLLVGMGLGALWLWLRRIVRTAKEANTVREEQPVAVDQLPRSPAFRLTDIGSGIAFRAGRRDSVEAKRFKAGLADQYAGIAAAGAAAAARQGPPRVALGVVATAQRAVDALHPDLTIPRRVLAAISLPERMRSLFVDRFVEVMAYPVIDLPMYKPLVDISSELFLPNINLIPHDSITLLETNQRFIEAYMVGLNHEMSREEQWREYPCDLRGTTFRQFWDVSSLLTDPKADPEQLRDIPPLHKWGLHTALGDHDQREQGGPAEEEVVLVIRGELLKRYPTAVVYAHRAEWQLKDDKSIDSTKERRLVELKPAEEDHPPRDKVKTPLYEAKVDPDIYFFGFDLTAKVARGESGDHPGDDPGWFFVIKERPGEPRFGLDIDRDGQLNVWNDLAWADAAPDPDARYIPMGAGTPTLSLTEPTDPSVAEKVEQYGEDKALTWQPGMNAADIGYILYQAPVLVAVHAQEMLGHG